MRMIGENLLVEMDEVQDRTESGLYLVHAKPKQEQRYGTIVKSPEGDKIYTEGRRIMVKINTGTPVDYNGKKHTIIQKNDVLMFVDCE